MNTKQLAMALTLAAAWSVAGAVTMAAAAPAASTLDNLQTAFNGETNAKTRYEAFAVKADADGYRAVAALFRAAAHSEGIHAAKHGKAITKLGAVPQATAVAPDVKTTRENLETALKGETAEQTVMYPAFIKQAELDRNAQAKMSFHGAMAAETEHAKLYRQALDHLDGWKAAGKTFLVCEVCGYTALDAGLRKCPVCAAPREKFTFFK